MTFRSNALPRGLLQFVFVLSGCAALIYQSIWSHYLGLILGHAAYAQSLVLMIFMGGMALGSWTVSRFTQSLRRPVAAYAVTEAVIGVMGLAFHAVFVASTDWSLTEVLPQLGSAQQAVAWQWASAALLIAPQTVLLGATFPLLAVGVLRLAGSHGRTLGGLYFTNGLGAALGALIATFLLLPKLGMPGALDVAGWLNLAVAALSAGVSLALREGAAPQPAAASTDEAAQQRPGRLLPALLAATFLSSAASFAYELGWVRMLNQAMGSSLHSFELMLAAFIAGLALGGLWVRRVGDRIHDLVRYAGFVQVLMAICAMVSIALLGNAYHWVPWLLEALARSGAGYVLYNVATAGIAVVVMAPAAFFAGMTLPLFTAALLRRGAGERAVGQVYAANTLGAILGVLVATHGLMPHLGVSMMLLLAGAVDLIVGLALLRCLSPGRWSVPVASAGLLGAVTLGAMLQWGLPDRLTQAAGVFRHGNNDDVRGSELLYYRDGATATISIVRKNDMSIISTNGKPDAGLMDILKPASPDEVTMVMASALPLAVHRHPSDVAIIGWGSGLTTHTLLGSQQPQRVDNIEIEQAMWEGAKAFSARNARAYAAPRSAVHFEDAREFFARGQRRYDVIISEPSNPWVTGVASLFTQEFYRGVKRSLKADGLLVQWVHSYEISDGLLAQMIAALLTEFPASEIYATNTADLLILAPVGLLPPLNDSPWQSVPLARELRRVGLATPTDMLARRLGGPAVLHNYVRMFDAPAHSDFFPTVSLQAPGQRFQGAHALLLQRLAESGPPVLQVLDCRARIGGANSVAPVSNHAVLFARQRAIQAAERFSGRSSQGAKGDDLSRLVDAVLAQRQLATTLDADSLLIYLANLANVVFSHVPDADQQALWDVAAWTRARPDLPSPLRDQLAMYSAVAHQQWPTVQDVAKRLLALPGDRLPSSFREQVLVLGMLAGMAQGQEHVVRDWEVSWRGQIPPAALADTRRYLQAWEAGREPVCAASRPIP